MCGSLVLLALFPCGGWGEPPCRDWITALAETHASRLARFQAKESPVPPITLAAGKAILQADEPFKRIPAKKEQWDYEICPLGHEPLKIHPAAGALDGVRVKFAGFRGELLGDTTLGSVFTWLDQPYEIRDRAGRVLFRTKAKV